MNCSWIKNYEVLSVVLLHFFFISGKTSSHFSQNEPTKVCYAVLAALLVPKAADVAKRVKNKGWMMSIV